MERIELTHWRRKLVNEMSKEELIEALTDSHHLWRQVWESGTENMVNIVRTMAEHRRKSKFILLIAFCAGGISTLIGAFITMLVIPGFLTWLGL